jgi:predicted ATP-grasp superfamily ATP-dependent carboligase
MTDTGAAVITGAALQANLAVIEMTGIQASAGHTLTLPTMTVLAAAFTDFQAGHSFIMRIINGGTGAYAWTLTAPGDASLVLTGAAMTINQYAFRDFIVTLTSATAGTVKAIGTSLNSGV